MRAGERIGAREFWWWCLVREAKRIVSVAGGGGDRCANSSCREYCKIDWARPAYHSPEPGPPQRRVGQEEKFDCPWAFRPELELAYP